MTTVAASRTEMAADSKVVDDGDTFYRGCKLYVIRDAIIGLAGDGNGYAKFLMWFREGEPEARPDFVKGDGNWSALVLRESGLFRYYESLVPEPIHEPHYAIGTGGSGAIVAMRLGKTPAEAVEIMCDVDNNTGRPVTVVRLCDVKPKRRARK